MKSTKNNSIMGKYFSIALVFFIILFSFTDMSAQKREKQVVRIETSDGMVVKGIILKQNFKQIRLRTSSAGIVTLYKKNIVSVKKVEKSESDNDKSNDKSSIDFDSLESYEEDDYKSYPSKYFFGSTGYGLKKGEGYYSNIGILLNEVNYGLSDNFSVGAGLVPLFLFHGGATPLWLKAKYAVPIVENQINFSTSVIFGGVLGQRDSRGSSDINGGVIQAVITFGSVDKNFSLGYNFLFASEETENLQIIQLSGKYKVSNRTYLICDANILLLDSFTSAFSILGARTMFRGIALDYGGYVPIFRGIDGLYILPYLGVKVNF